MNVVDSRRQFIHWKSNHSRISFACGLNGQQNDQNDKFNRICINVNIYLMAMINIWINNMNLCRVHCAYARTHGIEWEKCGCDTFPSHKGLDHIYLFIHGTCVHNVYISGCHFAPCFDFFFFPGIHHDMMKRTYVICSFSIETNK